MWQVTVTACLLGVTSFFTIAVGGLTVGMMVGLITALITKHTKEVRVVEPLVMLIMAYCAYMVAELLHWSGILSLVGCGIVQSHYAFKNISDKAHITVHYFISMLSSTMDCIIFLYLGMAVLDLGFNPGDYFWYPGFIIWTLVLCLLVRFLGVYLLTGFSNSFRYLNIEMDLDITTKYGLDIGYYYQYMIFLCQKQTVDKKHFVVRMKKVNLQEQFIMAYGGLRGGVGFSLVRMVDSEVVPTANMFVTTLLMVVLATVWIQGSTIKGRDHLIQLKNDLR